MHTKNTYKYYFLYHQRTEDYVLLSGREWLNLQQIPLKYWTCKWRLFNDNSKINHKSVLSENVNEHVSAFILPETVEHSDLSDNQ